MIALVSFRLLGIIFRIKDDADCIQVIYLVKGDSFRVHLVPDRVRSLDPLLDLEIEA